MRVFCPAHRVSFDAPESGPIFCEVGEHVLAWDFPPDEFWGHCCDCRHFWPSAVRGGRAVEAACPACMRTAARRYLCEDYNLLAVESAESVDSRLHETLWIWFGDDSIPVHPTCPICRHTAGVTLREHACEVAAATFVTVRAGCPFCGKPIGGAEPARPEPPPPPPTLTPMAAPTPMAFTIGVAGLAALLPLLVAFWLLAPGPEPRYTNLPPRSGDPPPLESPPDEVREAINREVKKLKPGLILFNPAQEMQIGKTEVVEVRITKAFSAALAEGLKSTNYPQIEQLEVGDYMGVLLTGSKDFFIIELKNREQKLIDEGDYTEWLFEVTPLKQGNPSLFLTAYNVLSTPTGDKSYEHPALIREIKVTTTIAHTTGVFLKENWKEVIIMVMGSGVLGLLANRVRRRRAAGKRPPKWERPL